MQTENYSFPSIPPNSVHFCHSLETLTLPSLCFFPSIYSGQYKCPVYIPRWSRIVLCHYGSNKLSLWNTQTLDLLDSRYTHEKIHLCATYSEKLNLLYCSGLGGRISAIELEKDCFGFYRNDILSPKIADEIVSIICIDKQNLIACTSGDENIYLLDSKTLKILGSFTLNEGRILSEFAYIPKNNILAAVSGGRKNEINFFCLKNRKCVSKIPICQGIGFVILKFCESRNMLITQCKVDMLKLLSLNSGQMMKVNKTIQLAEKPVSILLLEKDDCFLVSFQSEKLQLYRLSTGTLIQSFEAPFVVGGVLDLFNEKKVLIVNETLTQFGVIRYK